ncbi:MAG: DUF2254 domain-containing protein [Blastocatellia bacterium]|nr:DUF2254 domain-containing protein [Blastocatellia bacterium]
MPDRVRSEGGVPRVIAVAPDFQSYLETAFDQIRISGKGNQAIFERLATTIQTVAESTNDQNRRIVLKKQIDLIAEFAAKTLETDYEKEKVNRRLSEAKNFLQTGR